MDFWDFKKTLKYSIILVGDLVLVIFFDSDQGLCVVFRHDVALIRSSPVFNMWP